MRHPHFPRRTKRVAAAAGAAVAATVGALLPPAAGGAVAGPASQTRQAAASPVTGSGRSGPPRANTSLGTPVKLDTLFVGAHPDDEAFTLATLGQWNEYDDVRAGVVTVTRGEGGGNAVGPQEGPALGRIREAEERRAVAKAGIRDVFNLDKVDFYYTVSAPLTEQVWGHQRTLAKVVRLVRETRPEVLLTMNPAPSPGNHGNHQEAARLAIEAFYAAADRTAFPGQISRERLRPWAPAKILLNTASGAGATGRTCPTAFDPVDPTQDVFGVWTGRRSQRWGTTWAAVAREAQREYASQGWAVFPDVPNNPDQLGCNYFTLVDSRVPFPAPGSAEAGKPTAILDGALTRAPGGVPLGTGLRMATERFAVHAGEPFQATVAVTAPRRGLDRSRVHLRVPDRWTVRGQTALGRVAPRDTVRAQFTVTPPQNATAGQRARIGVALKTRQGAGYADEQVEVVAAVRGRQELLPQVAQFERWTDQAGVPQLQGSVTPVLPLASGRSRTVDVVVTNTSERADSGTVSIDLPAGFSANRTTAPYGPLGASETTTVPFVVTNTDATLPTSNQGGTPGAAPGDYVYTITTTSSQGRSRTRPALELVPFTTVPSARSTPQVDGRESDGEYPGPVLDVSRLWEGEACTSAQDCSATAKVSWRGDTLYVLVLVRDDVLGARLPASDCKRHWRTDAVEVAIDPRGTSENTSTTFKTGVLPVTAEGPPCYERDADNRQGPGEKTAPGMSIASAVSSPYTGYTVEMSIPMSELPSAVDPDNMGLNILVYDSDTQDKTGQTRLGWSTWGGVQGDPYRWGRAVLAGYTPPPGRPTTAPEPVIPDTALSSLSSPRSLQQAVRIDVPVAGGPSAAPDDSGWVTRATVRDGRVAVVVRSTGGGRIHLFVRDRAGTAGRRTFVVPGSGRLTVQVPLSRPLRGSARRVVAGWGAHRNGTLASVTSVRRPS